MTPLADLRIIALEQYGAGPFGSLQLADLGADVIKIEDPAVGGDVARYIPPYTEGEDSLFFESLNRNKRSINLDIRSRDGRAVFEDLVRHADAVYANLRGDVPEKLGIRYDDLKHINPRIVCCALSGFGSTGPRAHEPGYDYVLQGYTGWMALTGEPGAPPQKSGLSLVDFSGGLVAVLSLLAGVHAARRDGVGADCDVSLFDTAISMLSYLATWHLTEGYEPERTRRSAHPSLVPFQIFAAADGWLVISCAKEKFWKRLTEVIGRPDLADDPRFATFTDRLAHRDELESIIDHAFGTATVDTWLAAMREVSIPCAPINTVAQALADPQVIARNMLIATEHPQFGHTTHVNSPVRVGPPRTRHHHAPCRGADTDSVLTTVLGYTPEQITALHRAGVLG
ncbi:CaiB/BaiF CoA transferase family protein [Nocardia sp. 004]|uniref:CaiB/BaiF CoA transferase family protein n=1 Tax=Nocardia sp. 004 TaxID=3385978 RepID=UPI00399F04BD